ncbi:unnamed protein product [Penicillium roqueforti FM164]|uniref:Genomic scaffold, ProqFM164S01 n=1 Tax=Penicillium roqueforti (strain FM164) TaxID=1365484 RepID=W6PY98_PENRF|nr:unnamed protein product [Penicillium roqueforti FM164]
MFDADLHGPHNKYRNVMVPVVGEAACATGPSACAVSWGYGEMEVRGMGRREGEKKKNWGGGALLYPQPTCLPKVRQVPRTFPVFWPGK